MSLLTELGSLSTSQYKSKHATLVRTGSGSDRAPSKAPSPQAPGRYRSRYRTVVFANVGCSDLYAFRSVGAGNSKQLYQKSDRGSYDEITENTDSISAPVAHRLRLPHVAGFGGPEYDR